MGQRGKGAGKMASASSDYLLRGAVFALEQCGLLLRDSHILYSNRSYASAVALAAFAREELGRYRILRELWKRTVAGEGFTVKQIRDLCDDHVEKQREGMLSTVQRTDNEPSWVGYCRLDRARHLEVLNGKKLTKNSTK